MKVLYEEKQCRVDHDDDNGKLNEVRMGWTNGHTLDHVARAGMGPGKSPDLLQQSAHPYPHPGRLAGYSRGGNPQAKECYTSCASHHMGMEEEYVCYNQHEQLIMRGHGYMCAPCVCCNKKP